MAPVAVGPLFSGIAGSATGACNVDGGTKFTTIAGVGSATRTGLDPAECELFPGSETRTWSMPRGYHSVETMLLAEEIASAKQSALGSDSSAVHGEDAPTSSTADAAPGALGLGESETSAPERRLLEPGPRADPVLDDFAFDEQELRKFRNIIGLHMAVTTSQHSPQACSYSTCSEASSFCKSCGGGYCAPFCPGGNSCAAAAACPGGAGSSNFSTRRQKPGKLPREAPSMDKSVPRGVPPSQLSYGCLGHPRNCSVACKFFRTVRGCKDGMMCDFCHLCIYRSRLRTARGRTHPEGSSRDGGDVRARARHQRRG